MLKVFGICLMLLISKQILKDDMQSNVINGDDFLQIALDGNKMLGYIHAERGKFNRISHTAYNVN